MEEREQTAKTLPKKEIGAENFVFLACLIGFFVFFVVQMGVANTLNTFMNTAYSLLMNTVFYLMAICVLMGAVSALCSEFGVVALANRVLDPLMKPLYGLPGAASVGVVTTFLSDNPAILALAEDRYFKSLFKKYQFPALTNLGTAFGMGLIVCTYMISLSAVSGESYLLPVAVGLAGAVVGSVVSTRMMLRFTAKIYGKDEDMVPGARPAEGAVRTRPIREGNLGSRLMGALLEGGMSGVKMGFSIIPGVLIICTIVMMLTNGPAEGGSYTGAAYEGVHLLPWLADKANFILKPLFGFSTPECVGVPITALGAAGAATSMTAQLVSSGLANAGDIAVFTAMCMCWSGYLSTHVSMMNSLNCNNLISKAIASHTVGGLCAGVAAHWIYQLLSLL
ncbi:MAG: hypothetical protein IJT76_01385 [Clostridia bacterium]|nr:hypothetical protein [Clostridia bacterium]